MVINYLGSVQIKSATAYNSADILTDFPSATILIMKNTGIAVSVDGYPMFNVDFNEIAKLETGHTYQFNKDCVIAVGIYVSA